MKVGARYYDPKIGRWIQKDPILSGFNWWIYCENDPVNYVDPSGQQWEALGMAVVLVCIAIYDACTGQLLAAGIAGGLSVVFFVVHFIIHREVEKPIESLKEETWPPTYKGTPYKGAKEIDEELAEEEQREQFGHPYYNYPYYMYPWAR